MITKDNIIAYEKVLNPTRDIYTVIANLCNNPKLIINPDYKLSVDDFPDKFHKIVFSSINNLAINSINLNEITAVDIDNYLTNKPELYKVWKDTNGIKYIMDTKELSNDGLFEYSYSKIKKYALLRDLLSNGFDISEIYPIDDMNIMTESAEKLDSMTEADIMEHYTNKIIDVRNNWNIDSGTMEDFVAGDDLEGLFKELKEEPDVGYPYSNGYYNTLFRGMRESKYMLRSGRTGSGKSRLAVKDLLDVSCSEIYRNAKWESLGPSMPSMLISTELKKRELQLMMLAYISGINQNVISDGSYDDGTRNRLMKAMNIINKAPFFVSVIEDFSASDIEMKIEEYIIGSGVKFVSFDYIQVTPKLVSSSKKQYGTDRREDLILVELSASLKRIANKHDVYIISGTQLNDNWEFREKRNEASLRGSKAIADKVDHGVITLNVDAYDLNKLKPILDKNEGFANKQPNYSHWVYKNRSGAKDVVIWSRMDLGTIREEVLFVTDYQYNLIDMEQRVIEVYDDGQNEEFDF